MPNTETRSNWHLPRSLSLPIDMTTGTVPTIPSVETGTPPREWSESVLASSPKHTPATFSEILTRAGNAHATEETSQEAPSGLKTLRKQPGSSPISGKETRGRRVSLPSSELKGAQPLERTDGIGALPGNLSESSVALLPDERQERAQELGSSPFRQRRDTVKPSAAGGYDETQSTEPKGESETNAPQDTTLPKEEQTGSGPSDDPLQSTRERVGEISERDAAATSPKVETQKETEEMKSQDGQTLQTRKEQGTPAAGTDMGEYGGQYHPAQLHPPPPGASVAEYQSSVGVQQEVQDTPATKAGQQATEGAEKKPGFMSMFMGEMKILSGKVRGDEHKVAEGKKLLHGET